MSWNEVLATILLCSGAFFTLTGGVGILRFPDFYSRLHPAGKADTLGQLLMLMGLLFLVDWSGGHWLDGSKLILASILLLISAPTATHAITKAAHIEGLLPWTKGGRDPYEGIDQAEAAGKSAGPADAIAEEVEKAESAQTDSERSEASDAGSGRSEEAGDDA